MPTGREPMICLAAAPGGHLAELLSLRPAYEQYPHFYLLNAHEGRTDGRLGRVRHVPDYGVGSPIRRARAVVRLLRASVRIFLEERPTVLLTTGPATGLGLAVLVRATGGHVIYVECSAQVSARSRSGQAFHHLADRFYVQWPDLLEHYPRAEYHGLLL